MLVHDGTGTLAVYQPLLDAAGNRMRLAGLAVPDPDAYLMISADTLVDEVAASYVQVLRAAGEEGLQLAGQGFGGILAAEVARQLAEAGVGVGRLVVVAAAPPAWPPEDDLTAELMFWRELGITPAQLMSSGQAALRAEPREDRFARLAPLVPGVRAEEAYEVFLHSMEAAAAHQLLPYAGDIVLVLPPPDPGWPPRTGDVTAYWRDACLGDLTFVDLAGGAAALSALMAEWPAVTARWPSAS